MAVYEVKQYDTEPMEVTLRDRRGLADLSGATSIIFAMRAQAQERLVILEATADEDPETGVVTVEWEADSLSVPGLYDAEIEVTKADGKKQTFPSGGDPPYLVIDVQPEIARAVTFVDVLSAGESGQAAALTTA